MQNVLIGLGVLAVLLSGTFWYFSEADIPRATLEAKYASAPSEFVRLPNGARAHVRIRGPQNGRPLVLIHGSNASLLTWEPWAKRLSDTFRVVTMDMPAHGLTGAVPNGDYSQEGMVKFIGEVTDKLGLEKFALGGNSMGGRLAARFAEQYPDRVIQLILVDASGLPSKQNEPDPLVFRIAHTPVVNRVLLHITPRSIVVDGLNDAIAHKDIITDGMIDSYWDFMRMEGTRKATIARLNAPNNGVQEHIGDIKASTLILWGEEDHTVRVDAAYAFHAAIPGSKLIVYPKTGHVPQEEVADQSATDARTFLSGTQ
jgi:pimeloyl-ACP methyl ester carboxylesterase